MTVGSCEPVEAVVGHLWLGAWRDGDRGQSEEAPASSVCVCPIAKAVVTVGKVIYLGDPKPQAQLQA